MVKLMPVVSDMKRKVILVSIYYTGEEPCLTTDSDWYNEEFFLNDAINDSLNEYNPDTAICDVAIDEVKPSLHKNRFFFRLLRKKG